MTKRERAKAKRGTKMHDAIDRLSEIKDEFAELLREVKDILRGTPEEERAKSYWLAHIRCALDNEHTYLGGSMVTMQDTIDALGAQSER